MLSLRQLYLGFGFFSFAAFLVTGLYMHFVHGHLAEFELADRLFYRSRHIYILAAAVAQLGIGSYIGAALPGRVASGLQLLGAIALLGATPLLVAAFFFEHGADGLRSALSAFGLYALVGGTLAHVAASIIPRGTGR